MTNNLKAERTLTAFDAWFNEQEGYSLRSERFEGDVEWLKADFEAGALSTQQPMGEAPSRLEQVHHTFGFVDMRSKPNQESGE